MQFVVVLMVISLAACASEKLEQAPPAGVDFTGLWKLNEADSDDPQRMIQAQYNASAAGQSNASGAGSGGRGGRQRGGQSGADGLNLGGPFGPVMPSISAMGEGLRWPGKHLEIKQVGGVVAFISDGINRVCQPTDAGKVPGQHGAGRAGASPGRDVPRGRDMLPTHCGWVEKTLIVQSGDPDDDHAPFEEHYSLSEDRQRLVEVVDFRGGRSSGFTMSRVWDRLSP